MPALSKDYQLSSSISSKHHPEMELLPAGLVVAILQQLKGKPPDYVLIILYICMLGREKRHMRQRAVSSLTSPVNRPIFLCSFLINDPSLFETLCRQAYYTANPLSLGQATSMYGILYCLLKEYVYLESPLAQEHDLKAHASTCERNFCRGIETYQTLAMPCFENVLSLALGVGSQRHNILTSQATCSHHESNLDYQSARSRKAVPMLYTLGRRR